MKELFESLTAWKDLYDLQRWAKSVDLKTIVFTQKEFYKQPASEDDMYRKKIHDYCAATLEILERIANDKVCSNAFRADEICNQVVLIEEKRALAKSINTILGDALASKIDTDNPVFDKNLLGEAIFNMFKASGNALGAFLDTLKQEMGDCCPRILHENDRLLVYLPEVIESLQERKMVSKYIALEKTALFQRLDRAQYYEVSVIVKQYLDSRNVMQNRLNQFFPYLQAMVRKIEIGLYVCEHLTRYHKTCAILWSHYTQLKELFGVPRLEEVNTSPVSCRTLDCTVREPKVRFSEEATARIFNDSEVFHDITDQPRPDISEMGNGSGYRYKLRLDNNDKLVTGDTNLYERADKQYWVNKIKDREVERIRTTYFN